MNDQPASDPEPQAMREAVLKRIGRWTLVLAGVGTVAALAAGRYPLGLSLLLGGLAAYFGYRFQLQLVDRALLGRKAKGMVRQVFLRYGLIIVVLYAMIRFSLADATGFVCGLLLPALGVIGEGVVYLVRQLRGS